jgi:hypothetical protein
MVAAIDVNLKADVWEVKMSWIIQHLLSNKTRIKEQTNIYEKEYRSFNPSSLIHSLDVDNSTVKGQGYLDPLLENDDYNDILLVEKSIKELTLKGVLSDYDLQVLDFVRDGNISFSGETGFDRGRETLVKDFEYLCERLAFYMGGYFTNDGYIDELAVKYKLDAVQEAAMREYIQSRYRHTLIRRKSNDESTE